MNGKGQYVDEVRTPPAQTGTRTAKMWARDMLSIVQAVGYHAYALTDEDLASMRHAADSLLVSTVLELERRSND